MITIVMIKIIENFYRVKTYLFILKMILGDNTRMGDLGGMVL